MSPQSQLNPKNDDVLLRLLLCPPCASVCIALPDPYPDPEPILLLRHTLASLASVSLRSFSLGEVVDDEEEAVDSEVKLGIGESSSDVGEGVGSMALGFSRCRYR